jgi:hypothetical protein
MDFHLEFEIPPFPRKISYSDRLFFIGSCFSENTSALFEKYKFNTFSNPNGILYDPFSIERSLSRIVNKHLFSKEELFFHNEAWHSWDHHSCFSVANQDTCLKVINSKITDANGYLAQADFLFITFGSAFAYRHKNSGLPVANCHKVGQREFIQELLTVEEIVSSFYQLAEKIRRLNQDIQIIYTVSPVRYIRHGVTENTLSKSILIQAVHKLVSLDEKSVYFPAYELVLDDLRDYRFFKTDLVHPNEQAIQYVFSKLKQCAFGPETIQLFGQVEEIITAIEHKPFNPDSNAHHKFKDAFLEKCHLLSKICPSLDLSKEVEFFTS